MSDGSITPGDGLLLRAFKDHPADTVVLSYGAPKEKGRYHLAVWLGTWAEGETTVDERLGMLGWVFNPELARALRAETASTAAVGSASIHKPYGPAPTASDRTGIAGGKATE